MKGWSAATAARRRAWPSVPRRVIMSDEDARRPTHGTLAVDAVDAGDASPQALLDMMRRLRARERAYLASLLHDGPIQELAAVALELGEVRPPPTQPTEPNGLARQVH